MFERDKLIKSFQEMGEATYGNGFDADKYVNDLSNDLAKALSLGTYNPTGNAGTSTNDAGALRLQNLDATMTSVLFSEQNIKLWPFITKVPSIQPYYEWNRRRAYGSARHNPGFAEGGAPKGSQSAFERNGVYTKYLGVRRGITHQLTLTGQLGGTQVDPVGEENRNGTMELLEIIERNLVWGDQSVLNEAGSAVNYDGLMIQAGAMARGDASAAGTLGYAPHVVDKQGAAFDFTDIETASESLFTNGFVSDFANLHCFMAPGVLSDLSRLKLDMERKMLQATNPAGGYSTGVKIAGHDTNFGRIEFDPWLFTQRVKGDKPLTTGDPNCPAQPAVWTSATNAPVVAGSLFTSTNVPSTGFYYSIAGFNDSGEGVLRTTAAAYTPLAQGSVTLTFPAAPAGTGTGGSATGFRVYRGSLSNATDALWIADVPIGQATYVDKNQKVPGTTTVMLLNKQPETLAIAQMTPLIRFPLAITSTTIEWLLLLYHVPVLKAGERIFIWKNVGRLV